MKKLSTGVENFKIVVNECYYIDKTMLIYDVINKPSTSVMLFTRPRRFGKSLNISMIETFFSKSNEDIYKYFKNTKIANYPEIVSEHLGKYDVIHINMKDLSVTNSNDLILKTKQLIIKEFNKFKNIYLNLSEDDKLLFNQYTNIETNNILFTSCLLDLSSMIYKVTNKRVIILIDEYDVPMQTAYEYEFYDEIVDFYKRLYSETFKGNNNLQFGILTGVTKAAQLSLFSGFNNAIVNTVLDDQYNEYFGFTKEETKYLLSQFNLEDKINKVENWYGGYNFGSSKFFNPWSILKFCETNGKFIPYWTSTSSTSLIQKLLKNNYVNIVSEFQLLLSNKPVSITIDETTNFQDVNTNKNTILSFLLFLGYLTSINYNFNNHLVTITNNETRLLLSNQFKNIILDNNSLNNLQLLKEAFTTGNELVFNELLEKCLLSSLSYFDFKDEKNYQIMLLTLFSLIFDNAQVKSEVISGDGRSDIMITPKENNNFAAIIEVKHLTSRTSNDRLAYSSKSALEQIIGHQYYNDLLKSSADQIYAYGISFFKNHAHTSKIKIK